MENKFAAVPPESSEQYPEIPAILNPAVEIFWERISKQFDSWIQIAEISGSMFTGLGLQ